MENSKDQVSNSSDENPNPNPTTTNNNNASGNDAAAVVGDDLNNVRTSRVSSRTPFTNLSQVDADLALARTLQDQERAYMMLRMNGEGSDHESWETGSNVHEDDNEFYHHNSEYDASDADEEEDAFDVHAHLDQFGSAGVDTSNQLDPSSFPNDEAYARALQDAEDQEMAARLLALTGIHEMVTEDEEDEDDDDDDINDQGANSQDTWDDVDPDELSYEELIALGEVVGTESRGLSADSLASLQSVTYEAQNISNGSSETCVICRLDYEDGDNLILLSCKHSYHSECITNWLQINKVCPVCSTEVSTSGSGS